MAPRRTARDVGRRVGEASAILGTTEQGEVRGFPENKGAAGSQRHRQRGGRVPGSCSSWGQEKSTKSAESLCFISLATPAPSQAQPAGLAQPKHAAAGDRVFRAGAAASSMR